MIVIQRLLNTSLDVTYIVIWCFAQHSKAKIHGMFYSRFHLFHVVHIPFVLRVVNHIPFHLSHRQERWVEPL
jgi:hypothetical protein